MKIYSRTPVKRPPTGERVSRRFREFGRLTDFVRKKNLQPFTSYIRAKRCQMELRHLMQNDDKLVF